MKNLIRNLAFCALVAGTFTACHKGEYEDPSTTPVTVNGVVYTSLNKLVVRSNTAATFTLGTETKTGTEATFETNLATGTVNVTATGKRAVALNFDFNGGSYLEKSVTLVTEGTSVPAATAEAAGAADVENGDTNAAENDGVTASFNVGGNTNTGTTGDYSVTVFAPTDVDQDADDLNNGTAVKERVLSLDCQPDGAQFASPITVKVNIPGSSELNVGCFDEDGVEAASAQAGDQLSVTLNHFSIWDIIIKATCLSVTTEKKEIKVEGDASKGSLTYKFDYGFETEDASNVLINKYLTKLFGVAKKAVEKNITFTAVEGGTASLTVSQVVTTYTFKSSGKTFKAVVYGKVTEGNLSVEAPAVVVPTIRTHSGGSSAL